MINSIPPSVLLPPLHSRVNESGDYRPLILRHRKTEKTNKQTMKGNTSSEETPLLSTTATTTTSRQRGSDTDDNTNGGSSSSVSGGPRRRAGGGVVVAQHDFRNDNNDHDGADESDEYIDLVSATKFSPPLPPHSRSIQQQQQQQQEQQDEIKDRGRNAGGMMVNVIATIGNVLGRRRGEGRDNNGNRGAATDDRQLEGEDEQQEYYRDDFNDQSWKCSFGTNEDDGIWMNTNDQPGTIMSFLVWILIFYSGLTVTLLARSGHLPSMMAMLYCTLCAFALASHAKTTFTDPGSVPSSAVPRETSSQGITCHAMCSQCQTFKPPGSHHCRICNRCISRMDHHCPWMNNCIGAGNFKHFILFLLYTWTASVLALVIFGWNYFLCSDEDCIFPTVLVQLVRAMTMMCIVALLFTSSMIMNVTYGIMTGIGTIDRLKKKANNTMLYSDEEPIPLQDIFGIGGYYTWAFPVDPIFEDYDRVMGYSTPQRLLREEMQDGDGKSSGGMPPESNDFSPV